MMYETDPGKAQGLILVPDAATVTIDRGTFIASGNGVIGIGTEKPEKGVAAKLAFPGGHIAHLQLQIQ